MVADRKLFSGTPQQIVQQMRDRSFQKFDSLDAYMEDCRRAFQMSGEHVEIAGRDEPERCLAFLKAFVERDLARVEVNAPEHVDGYTVALLRRVLGLSQERLARQIGVAYTTVNRWENSKAHPNSALVASKVGRVARRVRSAKA